MTAGNVHGACASSGRCKSKLYGLHCCLARTWRSTPRLLHADYMHGWPESVPHLHQICSFRWLTSIETPDGSALCMHSFKRHPNTCLWQRTCSALKRMIAQCCNPCISAITQSPSGNVQSGAEAPHHCKSAQLCWCRLFQSKSMHSSAGRCPGAQPGHYCRGQSVATLLSFSV